MTSYYHQIGSEKLPSTWRRTKTTCGPSLTRLEVRQTICAALITQLQREIFIKIKLRLQAAQARSSPKNYQGIQPRRGRNSPKVYSLTMDLSLSLAREAKPNYLQFRGSIRKHIAKSLQIASTSMRRTMQRGCARTDTTTRGLSPKRHLSVNIFTSLTTPRDSAKDAI
jgi:hypothetical protein